MLENRPIDITAVQTAYHELAAKYDLVLVEGAGGLLVPIRRDYNFRDLAVDLNLEVVLVAPNRLGVINHVLLNAESIARAGLRLALLILNEIDPEPTLATQTNPSILEVLLNVPLYLSPFQNEDFSGALKLINKAR
jgi:dethiobiotin synthetase